MKTNWRGVRRLALPALFVGVVGSSASCSSTNPINGLGCDEFNAAVASGDVSAIAGLSIDANVKTFLTASAQFKALGDAMVSDVTTACVNIATAGGQMDT